LRLPLRSGVSFGRTLSVLTVRLDDPWAQSAVQSLGFRVLQVRHPLPACERIRVTQPLAVVVGAAVRPDDQVLIARAAGEVGAPVIVASFAEDSRLVHRVRCEIEAILLERADRSAALPATMRPPRDKSG